ncbi:glycine-rich RNA-binding protein 4, mitochondrial-like [Andrographis paniculata]|uniref:glycine-rich RNA-binding protein 4, mitochondrial-like n=1 Tax=Andrographis paniculata TaxID=175694 RepID=UPI0021E87F01|nr:glycine-rich RNA-binding protein 4, mitochondrial-like [Andrographis paniculata]
MYCSSRLPSAITTPLHSSMLLWRRSHSNLFVGGLSFDTNEVVLKDAFKEHGEVIEAKVICDRASGKSRGYGFVHYSSEEAASEAMEKMDGQALEGRTIRVRRAQRKEKQLDRV